MMRSAVRTVVSNALMALMLFGAAGTLAWPEGWAFLGIFNLCAVAIGIWLGLADPALLAERMKSPFSRGQRWRDQIVMAAITALCCAWFLLCGIDHRFGWSHLPVWAELAGAAMICAAFIGWVGVLRANSFAATTIRVQPERGQTVISSGPYAVVRHPMYAWALLFLAGVPLLLGSAWGLILVPAAIALLAARAIGEEQVLREALPGYAEYAARVRCRLVPGVW
jgi:protein-S-isoprenylcysteine O-methyltransferase Ste14